MAYLFNRHGWLYLVHYDFITRKVKMKTLSLNDTDSNRKRAFAYLRKFEEELNRKRIAIKSLRGWEKGLLKAKEHFLRNKSNKSNETYRHYINFFRYFEKSFDVYKSCSEQINKLSIEEFILSLRSENLSPNTIKHLATLCKTFMQFLFEYEYVPAFIISKDVIPRGEVVKKVIYSEDEINIIFDESYQRSFTLQLSLLLLFFTGLRPSDIMKLRIEETDFENQIFRFVSEKTEIPVEIPFHNYLVSTLNEVKSFRNFGTIIELESTTQLYDLTRRYFKKLPLLETKKKSILRNFRKTFTSRARLLGMDPTIVNELQCHAHSNVSDKFYFKISLDMMRSNLEKYKVPSSLQHEELK